MKLGYESLLALSDMTNKQILLILMGVLIAVILVVTVFGVLFITVLKKRAPVVKVVMTDEEKKEPQAEELAEKPKETEVIDGVAAEPEPVEEPAREILTEEVAEPEPEEEPEEEVVEEPVKFAEEIVEEVVEEIEAPAEVTEEPVPVEEPEEDPVQEPEAEEEAEEAFDEETAEEFEETEEEFAEVAPAAEELTVGEMDEATRSALGIESVSEDEAAVRFVIRYHYSFRAKLALSAEEVKGYYIALSNEIACYKKVKTHISFKQERVSSGRTHLAVMLFKGKKLCIAIALDPAEYAETKYRGIDVSQVKRFARTPMLLKISSPRKLNYALYLLGQLAEKYGLVKGEPKEVIDHVDSATKDELIAQKLITVTGMKKSEESEYGAFVKSVEEPVEEVADEVAEEPVEEVIEEVTEEPAEEAAEEVTEELAEGIAEEVTEEPVEEVAEEVTEEPAEEIAEEVTEEPAEEIAEEVTEEPVEEVAEEVTEEPVEEVAEEVTEEPVEEVAEEVAATEEEIPEEEPEPVEELPVRDFETVEEISVNEVEEAMTDTQAHELVEEVIARKHKHHSKKRAVINVDALAHNYRAGERVTVENLHEKGLIPKEAGIVKVLAKGVLNKPLIVEADDFSVEAVKMIVLTGGRAIRKKTI